MSRWALLLALVAGLVGMHHLMPAAPGGASTHVAAVAAPVMVAPAPAAAEHRAAMAMPSMDMAMHPCLAVLIALSLLLAGVALLGWVVERGDGAGLRGPVTARPRAPPRTAIRLALLCVLRN